MKPIIVSQSDTRGGAARAAIRLHGALRASGHDSTMKVRERLSDLPDVVGSQGAVAQVMSTVRPLLGNAIARMQGGVGSMPRSGNWLPSRWSSVLDGALADVVNLHWVGGETLSVADIGRIGTPVVWTLHDMWAFCGTEHYAADSEDARWRLGYRADNRPPGATGIDLDRLAWRRKLHSWRAPMHVVAPSYWLAGCARDSALFGAHTVHCIPNPLDTTVFRPLDRGFCREVLGLPRDVCVVLFGAVGGGADPRKGYDLLLDALSRLGSRVHDTKVCAVVFGQSEAAAGAKLPVETKWFGHVHDDFTLALLYNAADVTVVPSRQENLPQTATEAQACGCPVAAFDCSGLPDAVEHEVSGYLARAFDPADLARGIEWLTEASRRAMLRDQARARALRLWSPGVVIPRYLDVYAQAVREGRCAR